VTYRCILADPPWAQTMTGRRSRAKGGPAAAMPYQTMSLEDIKALPVADHAAPGAHLWLWTTNEFLRAGFEVMEAWGFKYLAPIHWLKPSGIGNWFVHRTQTMLFGYRERCEFPRARYLPNVIETSQPTAHSAKPDATYGYIESVSPGPRLELFARPWTPMFPKREGWHVWGNEIVSDITLPVESKDQPHAEWPYNKE
jgi:N6-adenosine-specific RNA methylase IME4